ncbi:MAG: SulP family inorganic anion transporter, partial [Actinomycetes bacterium]
MKSPISLPRRKDAKHDLVAGLTTGLVQIPDAMATAILAAVQPVNGLNTLIVGTPIGALFAGSIFMTVTTTGAIALAVADAVGKAGADERMGLLIMLTLMVGALQLALGLLKLGWITKFVSNSVMVGFITGVCILIILGQLGDLTGYSSEYSNKVVKTVDLVMHFNEVSWTTLAVGLATVALILLLGRTPVSKFAMVLAFAAVTIVVSLAGLGVQLVGDIAAIPSGLPHFQVPDIAKAPGLIVPAIAIAAIGLIQGAGVSKSVPNPGGEYGDDSRDFVAQGVANAAVSFFQGMPIGGSVSASALNVSSGARSRWANVYA